MDENFFNLFLFLELAFAFPNTNVLLFPVLGSWWVSSCLNNDTLECFDSWPHFLVQLLFHWVQVEGNVLSKARNESQGLFDSLCSRYVCLSQLYMSNENMARLESSLMKYFSVDTYWIKWFHLSRSHEPREGTLQQAPEEDYGHDKLWQWSPVRDELCLWTQGAWYGPLKCL